MELKIYVDSIHKSSVCTKSYSCPLGNASDFSSIGTLPLPVANRVFRKSPWSEGYVRLAIQTMHLYSGSHSGTYPLIDCNETKIYPQHQKILGKVVSCKDIVVPPM